MYYQCGGERIQVDHCRHDDDGPGLQPTPPQNDYCLVYYPDRPKNGGFMVQTTELRGDIVKKLQTCGTQSTPQPQHAEPSAAPTEPSAAPKTSAPSRPSTGTSAQQTLQLNAPYHCNSSTTLTVTSCAQQVGKEYCEIELEQNGKLVFKDVDLRAQVLAGVKSCMTQAASSQATQAAGKPVATIANGKSFNPPYLNEMPSVGRVKEAMKTSDPRETALRQIWVFYELAEVIRVLSGNREFARTGMLPDEEKIIGEYQVAQYKVGQDADKAFPNNKPSEDLTYHFNRWDTKFGFKGINIWQFFSEDLQSQFTQIIGKDNAQYAALRGEQKRIAAQGVSADAQAGTPSSGSPFIRNDPGTLAARRCVELGGNALECVGKGLWGGFMDMAGVNPDEMKGSETSGVIMNGPYTSGAGMTVSFGAENVSINGCGKLVPADHAYTVTKKPNQLLINVKSAPNSFVFSMGNDGKLSGPGPIDIDGQIISGYRRVWMQRYHNGVEVPGDGYWDNQPIYAPKTERCTIATFAQAPTPPPDKSPLTGPITSAIETMMPSGPTGLRMAGHYTGQGGLALEFAVDAVILDCGAAHVKQSYAVDNTSNQILITVKNSASAFTVALQPNGTLAGSGSTDVAGRVVTGSNGNGITYAARNARCAIGILTAKTGN